MKTVTLNLSTRIGTFAIALFSVVGCSTPVDSPVNPAKGTVSGSATSNKGSVLKGARTSYDLNWESVEIMPTPPGIAEVVQAPWKSNSNQFFSRDIINDYKKFDGWELVYNTFNDQQLEDNLYFMLYNKYRGVLRMYYYVPGRAQFINSNNVVHALSVAGSSSGSSVLMNFAAKSIVNLDAPAGVASKVEPYSIQHGGWYVLQYELAYDQNVANHSYNDLAFRWAIKSTQISTVSLDGTAKGTLTGTVKQASGGDLTASGTFNINNGDGQVVVNGTQDADKLVNILGSAVVDGIKGAITSGVSGVVTNLFGSIFGSGGGGDSKVELTVDEKISLSGTIQSDFSVSYPDLAVPGYAQDPTGGLTPLYNQPLGVYYLTSKPSVSLSVTSDGTRTGQTYTYSVDTPINYIVNPAVSSIATVQQQSVEIIAKSTDGTGNETISNELYTTGSNLESSSRLNVVGVRVEFKVTPNNGSAPIYLSKTFSANVHP